MAKVLVVDDEESFLTFYSSVLRKEGYEVLTVADARKACELAVSEQPDLILLDIMMEGFDGGDAAERLSRNASTRNIPVIFISSLVEKDEVVAKEGKIGDRQYISKSTPIPEFTAIVKEALSRKLHKDS